LAKNKFSVIKKDNKLKPKEVMDKEKLGAMHQQTDLISDDWVIMNAATKEQENSLLFLNHRPFLFLESFCQQHEENKKLVVANSVSAPCITVGDTTAKTFQDSLKKRNKVRFQKRISSRRRFVAKKRDANFYQRLHRRKMREEITGKKIQDTSEFDNNVEEDNEDHDELLAVFLILSSLLIATITAIIIIVKN
jgi:hypothetical protein